MLLEALEARVRAARVVEKLYVYAGLRSFEDLRNADNSALYSRGMALSTRLDEAVAFFSPELLAIPPERLQAMVAATPGLSVYGHYLDDELRLRDHTLDEAGERLLAMAADPLGKFQRVYDALANADLEFGIIEGSDGERIVLSQSLYGRLMESPDRRVRRDAWTTLFGAYAGMASTLAANYEGHVKGRVFEARARGFDSALQAATARNGIPEAVYRNVVEVVRESAPVMTRYLELRRRVLGVETLEIWDNYAPMLDGEEERIGLEDAKRMVAEALAPLGDDYLAIYWRGFEEGWVDFLPNKGKRSGAYSWGSYDSKPFFAMNYEGTLTDVSTLAHEYGHSVHSFLARGTQPHVYGYNRTFTAEVASMTNEALLYRHLLEKADSARERARILQSYLDDFRGAFFVQAAFADYEMQAHARVEAGEALTRDALDEIYASVFAPQYGDVMRVDPLHDSGWTRIPHFLRTDNFYVYQYATSFAAATALAQMIREEGEPARERFLAMLRSGSSDYPIELLKSAGVDMTTPAPIRATVAVFEAMVGELEQALAEL